MKRIFALSLFCLLGYGGATAQQPGSAYRADYRNGINLIATMERSSYNTKGIGFGAEYTSKVAHVMWFGVEVFYADFDKLTKRHKRYDDNPMGYNPYINTVYYRTYQAVAKVLWVIPVAGDWLALRVGCGAGLFYNDIIKMPYHSTIPDSEFRPLASVEANWLVRLLEGRLELKFSPFIWGPSHFRISPVGVGRPARKGLFNYDMAHFSAGIKF